MPVAPGAIVILVCPQCGKKYKGDASKPDARYQCPVDQSTLIRLDTAAGLLRPENTPPPAPPLTAAAYDGWAPGAATPGPDLDGPAVVATPAPFIAAYDDAGPDGTNYTPPPPSPAATPAPRRISLPTPPPLPAPAAAPPLPPAAGGGVLSGFEQRRSVVAALEGLGAKDPITGGLAPVYKYELKSKLGQGGMGEVYKVLDRDLRREVALKRLRPQPGSAEEEDLLRFIKEAQATGRLEHPNIVPVHDLGVDGEGRVYFTLKYVKGLSLKEVIRGRRDATLTPDQRKFREVFSPRQMIEILISVCNAVAYAHSRDLIHRDLKPDNIMLGDFGEVLVMDWGLAKILKLRAAAADSGAAPDPALDVALRTNLDSNMTMEGAIAGTPAYMSPEQAEGRISELDPRTDVYSLGAILHEMLSGDPPYKGATALEVVRMVTEGPPPPLSAGTYGFRPIPRELKAIAERAMAHEPEKRYASAEALRDELTAFLEDKPVASCPDTFTQRSVKWAKRNRHRVTSITATVVGILVLILLCWFGYQQITVHALLARAQSQAQIGKLRYQSFTATAGQMRSSDPNQLALQASAKAELASIYREHLNAGIDLAHKALELSPRSLRARNFLADSYMDLWRLALDDGNQDLMKVYSGEVLRYASDPDAYRGELEGLGNLALTVEPGSADVYLFRFETLHSNDRQGNPLPSRLIPVPYDPGARQSDQEFLQQEAQRAQSGGGALPNTHSIYKLDPTPQSRLGSGSINVNGLPPGSYLLVLLDPTRQETHIPFNLERAQTLARHIVMPALGEVPAGFTYVDGGPAWVGGSSANALPRQLVRLSPFVIGTDEVSMGEYAQFLKSIGAEARQRLPRAAGKDLATLANGALLPADGSDAQKFAHSPARGVSLSDAQAYIAWRSKHDGIAYRLPTQYEWETACHGADGRLYPWGNVAGRGLAISLNGRNDPGTATDWNWQDYRDESPWGVHDLGGGVAEWTGSLYDSAAAAGSPLSGVYTVKGDAWSLPPAGLECAFRTSGAPDFTQATIGFRLAADWPVKHIGEPQPEQPQQAAAPAKTAAPSKPKPQPNSKLNRAQQIVNKLGLNK